MKKLILINGTMGAGKTTTCQELLKILQPSVFLDGDWCWKMHPFIVNEETKNMVVNNICFLLNNFIRCSEYKYVIFCWVMHQNEIIDEILNHLNLENTEPYTITLTLTEEALTKRLNDDISKKIRQPDILKKSIDRIGLYSDMNTWKVDVSSITPYQAALQIQNHLNSQ